MLLRLIFSVALLCAAIYMLAQNNVGVGTLTYITSSRQWQGSRYGDDVKLLHPQERYDGMQHVPTLKVLMVKLNGYRLLQGKQAGTDW